MTLSCLVERVAGKYKVSCRLDGKVVYTAEADSLRVEELCRPDQMMARVCNSSDITCVLEKYVPLLRACKEAVEDYVPVNADPGYGILPPLSYKVKELVARAALPRVYVYQGGYFVEAPSNIPPSQLRRPDAEVEIEGRKIRVGDLLAQLGIDPSREYHVVPMPKTSAYLYTTYDGDVIVLDIEVPKGAEIKGWRSQSLARNTIRVLETSTGWEAIRRKVLRALGIKENEGNGQSLDELVVGVTIHPPSRSIGEVLSNLERGVAALLGARWLDERLKLVYLAVGMGGYIGTYLPHTLLVTPPGVGKSFLGERVCLLCLASASEASLLGGANVARGIVFRSILEGKNQCVQVEHLESQRRTLISELLQLMASGVAGRAVLGQVIETRSLSPFVFTANTGDSPQETMIAILATLTSNQPATGRRFGLIVFDDRMTSISPSHEDVEELSPLRLMPLVVGHPVWRHKVERLYRMAYAYVDELPMPRWTPVGSKVIDSFMTEYTRHCPERLFHAALNIAASTMLQDIWDERITVPQLVDHAMEYYKQLLAMVQESMERIRGAEAARIALESLPRYARMILVRALEYMRDNRTTRTTLQEIWTPQLTRELGQMSIHRARNKLLRILDRLNAILGDKLAVKEENGEIVFELKTS